MIFVFDVHSELVKTRKPVYSIARVVAYLHCRYEYKKKSRINRSTRWNARGESKHDESPASFGVFHAAMQASSLLTELFVSGSRVHAIPTFSRVCTRTRMTVRVSTFEKSFFSFSRGVELSWIQRTMLMKRLLFPKGYGNFVYGTLHVHCGIVPSGVT